MKLAPIMDRITSANLGFKAVEGVEAVGDLATTSVAMPACFVVQATEEMAPEQEGAGLIVLNSVVGFDVVIMVNVAARRGKNRDELSDFADAAMALLLGWTPDASVYRPIVPVSGRLLGLEGGRASWIIRFRTSYRLRKQG